MKKIGFLSFGHWSDERGSLTRSAGDVLLQSIDLAVAAEELGAFYLDVLKDRLYTTPANGLPRVQTFTLPIDELQQVAAASGLQWVNSDADKIAAVQAAIAAEPKPIRVPRERPPAVVLDEGPLVLVETRRDLSAMALPFEQPPAA